MRRSCFFSVYGLTVRIHRMGNYTDLTIYHTKVQFAHLGNHTMFLNHERGKPHGGEFEVLHPQAVLEGGLAHVLVDGHGIGRVARP